MRTVNADNLSLYCLKDPDDRTCLRCHMLSLDSKFILHKDILHVINKHIITSKQLPVHNIYIIRCLLCNSWDTHYEATTPCKLIHNRRTQGFSLRPDEHTHTRNPGDVMIYPVWSYHTATCYLISQPKQT